MKRWDEFPENTVMVGVFDAEISDLAKRMAKHNPKFTIVADESYQHFLAHGVEKSTTRVMLAPLRAPLTTLEAILRGYIPMTMSMSKMSTIPVDVLIDEEGKVVEDEGEEGEAEEGKVVEAEGEEGVGEEVE